MMSQSRHGVLQVASELYQQGPSWVTFFREVLGLEGIVRQVHSTQEEMAAFEQTAEYAEIQAMLAKLRDRGNAAGAPKEPTRVITVRMPKSLHESLRAEAHDQQTSMNQLCISKLLMVLENGLDLEYAEPRDTKHSEITEGSQEKLEVDL